MLKLSYRTLTSLLPALLLSLGLSACGPEESKPPQQPVKFESGDECHLCGMAIMGFPGPKGEAYVGRPGRVVKFCSTRDLISWYLQPENRPNTQALFVHDMARSDWQHPDDRHLIDGRAAWYVLGSRQAGAMGPTLASFASKKEAETFANQWDGDVLSFQQLSLEKL